MWWCTDPLRPPGSLLASLRQVPLGWGMGGARGQCHSVDASGKATGIYRAAAGHRHSPGEVAAAFVTKVLLVPAVQQSFLRLTCLSRRGRADRLCAAHLSWSRPTPLPHPVLGSLGAEVCLKTESAASPGGALGTGPSTQETLWRHGVGGQDGMKGIQDVASPLLGGPEHTPSPLQVSVAISRQAGWSQGAPTRLEQPERGGQGGEAGTPALPNPLI